ncbi:SAC3 family protein 1 like [Verticillium longisporum]|nr:SAC3 family protein 1 like [Verticillium longisporum]
MTIVDGGERVGFSRAVEDESPRCRNPNPQKAKSEINTINMAKGKWIDKKSAQHFTLVHRPQNDPLINDENAPSMVFNPTPQRGETSTSVRSKTKHLDDLASEFGSDISGIRQNEGEAAEYGIYYDDSEYDYMQHMRDLNTGAGEAVWVEAEAPKNQGKGKQTQSLEDAIRGLDVKDDPSSLGDDARFAQGLPKANYQSQQDIPDAIAGLQPDMDPRLREVLEALDDDAYVEEDDDIFQELAKDGREISQYEFEDQFGEEDDGWESDHTAKPNKEYNDDAAPELVTIDGAEPTAADQNEDWLEDFKQFKKDQKNPGVKPRGAAVDPSEVQSSMWTTTTMGGRRKKRKGALTNPSSYSMTSSSMVRTEQLTLLDARFDRIEEEYTSEMGGGDDLGSVSAVSAMSSVQGETRHDLDNILDDFLGKFTKPGKRTNKKARPQTGLEQLDEIRRGLGPARLRPQGYSPKPRIFGALAPSAADIAEPTITGLDGAGDVRWAKRNRTTTQRDTMNGFGAKRRAGSPADGASSDDGRKRKGNGALDRRKKVTTTNGKNANTSKPRPSNVTAFGTDTTDYDADPGTYDTEANSTYAKRIYDQLRKDRILPPKWPSDPGNPASKGAMAKYRETSKSYRDRARASLMAAGLIDDPDKPKRLEDAIDFKGICEDMCPNFEKITRITEFDVQQAEKDSQTSFPVISKMVKKLARSAAGQEAPLPMDVRSTAALRRTLDYLVDDLLEDEDNLPILHGYLWDRTRAIRRDFIFHSSMSAEEMKDQVYCLETIARFHVTSLHLLSRPDVTPEDFSEQQEIEQLGKALLSLMHAYDDSKAQGLVCENETEFRAYQLLFSANQPNILDNVQQEWANPRLWKDSDEIRTAVSLVEALQSTTDLHGPMGTAPHLAVSGAYNTYFKIVENPEVSYTMACFAEIHFGQLRRSMLKTLRRAYWRPKVLARDITPALLNTFLRFDTEDEAIDFVEEHGMSWVPLEDSPDDEYRQYLRTTDGMEFPRLHHTTSETIVEKKRGSQSLSEVIHRSVYEDPSATAASNRSGAEKPFLRSTAKSQSTPNASALQGFQKPTNGFATSQPTATPFSQDAAVVVPTTNGHNRDAEDYHIFPFLFPTYHKHWGGGTPSSYTVTWQARVPVPQCDKSAIDNASHPARCGGKAKSIRGAQVFDFNPTYRTTAKYLGWFDLDYSARNCSGISSHGRGHSDISSGVSPHSASSSPYAKEGPYGGFHELIVKKTYDEFVKEEAERKRREEEERDLAEARKFQVYNLSVKFFYRWREIARKNRLHRRRVRDREEYKAALAEKFAAEAARKKKAKQVEAARLAALQRSKGIDPVDEFRNLLQMQKDKSQDHEDALWASGILAGIHDEREAIASIVRHHMPPPAAPTPKKWKKSLPPSNVSISRSESAKPGSAKTQALREKFSASTNNRSTSFRRSLPSSTGSSSFRASPSPSEPSKRQSRVSDRWRLKAMGLVTMPDGTALPESLANSMRYDGARYDGWGSFGLDSKTHHRSRSTSADVGAAAAARERFSQSFHNRSASEAKGPRGASPTTIKRKRSVDDEQSTAVDSDTKKRKAAGNADLEQILRDAKETLSALRSSRMELDEGAGWFREQSEMMQQEEALSRRSSSAWGERL